jgi:hypothetical protein
MSFRVQRWHQFRTEGSYCFTNSSQAFWSSGNRASRPNNVVLVSEPFLFVIRDPLCQMHVSHDPFTPAYPYDAIYEFLSPSLRSPLFEP